MKTKITPKRLKGFNDYFADDVKLRQYVINTFKQGFERFGYEPLETPALEYTECMKGFSGEEMEKLFYRFEDRGGRDIMLKAEVMMGMCRAVASNYDKVAFPYKRYQIQPVWRFDNAQKGRLREFTQCDADTVGSSSMRCDAEFIQMGLGITESLGFTKFAARVSNRKFLNGLAEYVGITGEQFYGMCISLDKLKKIGLDGVKKEMTGLRGLDAGKVEKLLDLVDTKKSSGKDAFQVVASFGSTVGETSIGREGLDELLEVFTYLREAKIAPDRYMFDSSLARGLAYYTGPIWEFEVTEGGVGSIAGCGRYDDVIGAYLGEDKKIPATGGSFGIERICIILRDRKMVDLGTTTIDVLVTVFEEDSWKESLRTAEALRKDGLSVMLYPEADRLKKQFAYANRKGIPWVVVVGPDEIKAKKVQLKNMINGKQERVAVEKVVALMKK